MKQVLTILLLLILSPSLHAVEAVDDKTYFEDALIVTASPEKQRHVLLVYTEPGTSAPVYALKGMVRYENVEGDAFLQMDNDFGEKGTFFTKSLAASGPLGKISGSSGWRPFVLPFNVSGGDQAERGWLSPEELTLALQLPGAGTVSIRDVRLYRYATGENPLAPSGQWFSDRNAGLVGGIAGGVLGLWGALIGVLSSRGKARGLVLGSANVLIVIGIASLAGGVVALATDQPYAVYYPLLLIGVIVVVVMGGLRRSLPARYEQLEMKRMQSMDV